MVLCLQKSFYHMLFLLGYSNKHPQTENRSYAKIFVAKAPTKIRFSIQFNNCHQKTKQIYLRFSSSANSMSVSSILMASKTRVSWVSLSGRLVLMVYRYSMILGAKAQMKGVQTTRSVCCRIEMNVWMHFNCNYKKKKETEKHFKINKYLV